MSRPADLTDVIIRFHAPDRLAELERAVLSVVAQRAQPVVAHVVTQRFTDDEVAVTQARLAPLFQNTQARLELHNWRHPKPVDARSCLINFAAQYSQGHYLSFLDYDDVLFPEAHEILRRQMQKTGAAISFASVQLMSVAIYEEFCRINGRLVPSFGGKSLFDLYKSNFAPLHSFMIDKNKVYREDIYFDESMTWEEDYEFLLRICSKYKSDFDKVGTMIGLYFYKTDGSNSIPTTLAASIAKQDAYKKVQATIAERKRAIAISTAVLEDLRPYALMGTPRDQEPVTIADVVRWRGPS